MKYLIAARTLAESAELPILKRMLEHMRIECMIRNENLAGGMGEIPFMECFPELWILDDRDYRRAQETILHWRSAAKKPNSVWICPHCEEIIDGQFSACWQCGTERA